MSTAFGDAVDHYLGDCIEAGWSAGSLATAHRILRELQWRIDDGVQSVDPDTSDDEEAALWRIHVGYFKDWCEREPT